MEIYMGNIRDIPYTIRWAKPEDWPETMQMVWRTFMRFEAADYTEFYFSVIRRRRISYAGSGKGTDRDNGKVS